MRTNLYSWRSLSAISLLLLTILFSACRKNEISDRPGEQDVTEQKALDEARSLEQKAAINAENEGAALQLPDATIRIATNGRTLSRSLSPIRILPHS